MKISKTHASARASFFLIFIIILSLYNSSSGQCCNRKQKTKTLPSSWSPPPISYIFCIFFSLLFVFLNLKIVSTSFFGCCPPPSLHQSAPATVCFSLVILFLPLVVPCVLYRIQRYKHPIPLEEKKIDKRKREKNTS